MRAGGQFRALLVCKAVRAGKRVVLVASASANQDWSRCGARVEKSLSVRTHLYPSCG